MIAGIESGEIGYVLVKDLSRVGRDYLQVGFYTEVMFKERGVRFIAIANGVDSDKRESSEFAPFLNIMNEWYVRDSSRKITSVLHARGMSGKHTNSHWRKEAAKRSSHYTIALEEIEACIAAPNTVEAEIEAKELARIIEAFLDTLTTENRVIFMRRYWFSDSYKDIAEFMGLSEKNISVRLTRIREKMKQYLIEREVFV